MPEIYYLPDERLVKIEEANTILEASLCSGIPHTHACGGSARCSTCRVLVIEGLEHCSPQNDAEQHLTERLRFGPTIRLACQTQIIGEGKVTVRRLALDMEDLECFQDQAAGRASLSSFGEEKNLAILFADIRGFTSFSEAVLPYDVVYVLNRYFQRMGEVIRRHGGLINNYMGDGLMALFGVEDCQQASEQAVRAALEMLETMQRFNPFLEMLYHRQLQIGIGIHYGCVVLGTIGDTENRTVTAIGDAVNFASRIESANKQVGTHLLISEAVFQQVKALVTVQRSVQICLPGKSGEYTLHEVTGIAPDLQMMTTLQSSQHPAIQTWGDRWKQLWRKFWATLRRLFKK